jgi:hypothetical protein
MLAHTEPGRASRNADTSPTGGRKMLSRPSVSFPFRHVTTERRMLTATTAKPTMRGIS